MKLHRYITKKSWIVSPLGTVTFLVLTIVLSLAFLREIWTSTKSSNVEEVSQKQYGIITVYEGDKIYQINNSNHKETKGEVSVPYDMTDEEASQKQVDEGHSPWRLDPAFVALVFASLLISPEGIVGDYPIAYKDIEITNNNGITAVATIHDKKSPAKTVYLERLVRTDESGIWTVVGYDKAE